MYNLLLMKNNLRAFCYLLLLLLLPSLLAAQPDEKDLYAKAMVKGNGHLAQRDFFDAREAYREALSHKPNDKTAKEKIEECEQRMQYEYRKLNEDADKAFEKGQMEKAGRLYEKSLAYFENADIAAKLQKTKNKPQNAFFRSYGTKHYEEGRSIARCPGGGYIAVGRAQVSTDNSQVLIVKVDNNGNETWRKTYGEGKEYMAEQIVTLKGGGYLIVGYSEGESVVTRQAYLLMINDAGSKVWEKSLGGGQVIEQASAAAETNDGGFVIVGQRLDITADNPNNQLWVLKTDNKGNTQWEKEFGGEGSEEAGNIVTTSDGYLIVGSTESIGSGSWDMWLIKIDNQGNERWNKPIGGGDIDRGHDLLLLPGGDIIVAGYTYSFAMASSDAWLLRLDPQGEQKWDQVFGGLSTDEGLSISLTKDQKIILTGYSEDFEADNYGQNISLEGQNVLLVLADPEKGSKIWSRSLGGERAQRGFGVVEAHDGGFIITGMNMTSGTNREDLMFMKADTNGLTTATP